MRSMLIALQRSIVPSSHSCIHVVMIKEAEYLVKSDQDAPFISIHHPKFNVMSQAQIQITYLPLAEIQPSHLNPRKHFDKESLQELARSINELGVLEPILVRLPIDALAYEIVAGERRYRASLIAGLETIPAII